MFTGYKSTNTTHPQHQQTTTITIYEEFFLQCTQASELQINFERTTDYLLVYFNLIRKRYNA